jgi:hypothetical protein
MNTKALFGLRHIIFDRTVYGPHVAAMAMPLQPAIDGSIKGHA